MRIRHSEGLGHRVLTAFAGLILTMLCNPAANAADVDKSKIPAALDRKIDFREDVYPLLEKNCFSCHHGAGPSSGARLDLHATLLGETNGRPLVIPGKSAESPLIHLVSGALKNSKEEIMPPKGKPLSAQQIGLLRAWIDQGVAWDDELLPSLAATKASLHWAFQPVRRPAVPLGEVDSQPWARNPVDFFVARRQREIGVTPTPEASRQKLARRLFLGLTGLPPTPAEIEKFMQDDSPRAYERLVERLLASPRYGERWGRHWLDIARFAESEGYNANVPFRTIWRYRDYVIGSFNRDQPFPEFIRQQVAGDQIEPYADENLIATGFLAAARLSGDDIDVVKIIHDVQVDIVNATTNAVLGLTMACAQCHDHKFDPITQLDYYRLQAFFVKGLPGHLLLKGGATPPPPEIDKAARDLIDLKVNIYNRILAEAYLEEPDEIQRIMHIPEEHRTMEEESVWRQTRARVNLRLLGCNQFRYKDYEKKRFGELNKLLADGRGKGINEVWGFYSPVTSPHIVRVLPKDGNTPILHDMNELYQERAYLLRRGNLLDPVKPVEPGLPVILASADDQPRVDESRHPRLELARWLSSEKNPLSARVWVNRIWHYHFGRGIVKTPGNFGLKGTPPTHPELLDWLASEFVRSGWSTKHVQRLIVNSATFRLTGIGSPEQLERDPTNDTYWRWSRRRLESEAVRDSILSVSGLLDGRIGGPSTPPRQESRRRSTYLAQFRDIPPEMQALFDGPTAMSASCSERSVSTTSLQPLYLLNNAHSIGRATEFADRVRRLAGEEANRQVDLAFRLALSRSPTEKERAQANAFLRGGSERKAPKIVERALSLWLRTDTGVLDDDGNAPKNGEPVSAWKDQCVGENRVSNDLAQDDPERRPVYITDPGQGINGKPVLRFAKKEDAKLGPFLSTRNPSKSELNELDLTDRLTVFGVMRFRDKVQPGPHETVFSARVAGESDADATGAWNLGRFHGPAKDGKPHAKAGKIALWLNNEKKEGLREKIHSTHGIASGGPVIVMARLGDRNLDLEIYQPGSLVCADRASVFDGVLGETNHWTIGGYDPSKEFFAGDLGELLVYRDRLSEEEKAEVLGALEARWGLGHPPQTRLVGLCQAILNLNEVFYIE